MYGSNSGNYQIYGGTSGSTSVSSVKAIPHQTASVAQTGVMNSPKLGRPSSLSNPNTHQSYNSGKALGQPNPTPYSAPLPPVAYVKEESIEQTSLVHNPQGYSSELGSIKMSMVKDEPSDRSSSKVSFSTAPQVVPANSGRTPPKKAAVGQKKPLDSLGSPPQSSKKQKVSGGFLDQSIEQLNDVTAVSGVNLSEEEEQLLSAPKEDSRVSEASRKVVQEEEERLILERAPLRKMLADIMTKCGLKSAGADVEKCLSLCVEERIRGLLCNLIRLSKQRVDVEKARHRTLITSDVRQQIMFMNRKAKEEWDKKQAEAEKLRKVNENDSDGKADAEKDKDDGRQKPKVNKEEDDKMRTNAANVAARAAVGVDDMLSKWQLIAQARQKREVSADKEAARKTPKNPKDPTKRSLSGARKTAKSQHNPPQTKVVRAISVKDVISALERESQMSKSTLIYRLYEKTRSDPTEQ